MTLFEVLPVEFCCNFAKVSEIIVTNRVEMYAEQFST